jgi:hypothetical protein
MAAGLGVGDATPALGGERVVLQDGVLEALARVWSGRSHPQALRGGLATPKRPKPILFFFFLAFGGGQTTPLGHGGGSTTTKSVVGVAPATLWPKMGWLGHPIFGQATLQFPSLFFFFLFKKINFSIL